MGCGSSQEIKIKEFTSLDITDILKEPENEVITIDEIVPSYPPPKPDSKKKIHIFTDEDAKIADSRATLIKAESVLSMTDLAEKLTSGLQKDVQRLRALFTWMGLQRISAKQYPTTTGENTLLYHMKRVKERFMSYSIFFIMLCRSAKIPCVMIRGLAKSVAYEVGDQDIDDCTNHWTAAYVAGGWRFVFPLWAFSARSGYQAGKWTLVETEEKGVREKEKESKGVTISQINEYFFLTDPESFIYVCFPNDEAWQLLTAPFSKRQFIDVPYFKPAYFEHDVSVTSKQNSVLHSENALCDISLRSGDNKNLNLIYRFYYNHEESKTPISDDVQLDRFVACLNEEKSNTFKIRFPCEGIFKMQIYGLFDDDPTLYKMLCSFKLICNEKVSDVTPFPCTPAAGFGPTSKTEEYGLVSPTHKTGFIHVREEKHISVKFTMIKTVQVQAALIHNQVSSEELQHNVTHKVKGNELSVDVNVPNSEEYALQINTRDKDSHGDFKNACNYLISSTHVEEKEMKIINIRKTRIYENAWEKRARKGLVECLTSKDPETIQKALDEFQKHDLQDPEIVMRAEKKKTYHILAQDLRDAINTRNIERLEKAIDHASSSEFEVKLSNLIKSAEELLQHLRKLKRFSHEVLKMSKPTISEITNYKYPIPLAYDIMKATYLLLGEKERNLQKWEMITNLMRKTGKEALLRRIHNYDTLNAEQNITNQAAKLLRQYTEDDTKKASVGIATFYVWITIDEILSSYPPPRPDSKKKSQIFTEDDAKIVDSRATLIKAESVLSMEELAEKLTSGLQKDVQRLRALFTWMGLQQISTKQFPANTGNNTLLYHMKRVKEREMSYSTFFTILCRAAKIPCVLIRGLAKSAAYEVGDQELDGCGNCWTAVYVADGWRFVFPLWAFSAISGYHTGKWTLVETEGVGVREEEKESEGVTISQIDEFYFLTNPEFFVHMCLPNDEAWQLLTTPFTKRKFIDVPQFEQAYFEHNVKVISEQKSVLKSKDAICDITLKSGIDTKMSLKYKLYYNHEESKMPISDEEQLDRYVACLNQQKSNTFKIRFPCEGIFKIDIFGLFDDDPYYKMLCAFKLICNETISDVRPFPCNPDAGFGPSSTTEESGLVSPTHKTGFIHVREEKHISVKFTMIKTVQVQAVLVHNQISSEELQHNVTHKVKGNELSVDVNVPNSEEYALQINTRDKDSHGEFRNACNYLISSTQVEEKEMEIVKVRKIRLYENALEKRARKGLEECLTSRDPETIQKALDEFQKHDLEDPEIVSKAERKKTYHMLAKDLRDAINTRNIEKLEKAIQHASSSEFEVKLSNLIKSAEELLQHLRKLKRFSHEVLKMSKPTISEITNYKYPRPLAYDIMKATYLLLGEREHNLQEWEMITGLMRRTGKEGLLRRVRNYDTLHSEENITNQAAKLLRQYTEDETKKASVGIATFYVWSMHVVTDLVSSS